MSEAERESGAPAAVATEAHAALFPEQERLAFRSRWDAIQTEFVDEPRTSVQQADALVAETVKRLDTIFGEQRAELERQWAGNGEVSTEDLRQALRRYRSFFDRLLAM